MIYLRDIEIEGFCSVLNPIKYRLDRVGINKIEGLNGAGKTTVLNALVWVLYKKLVKKKSTFKPWPHTIGDDYKGTIVKLNFDSGKDKYQIIRCDEYKGKINSKMGNNRLIIMENGKELMGKDLRNKDDYQKWIANKIGYSFELFTCTVIFPQELDNLMQEDGPYKKKIFDEAFETTFVNRAKELVEAKLKPLQNSYSQTVQQVEVLVAKKQGIKDRQKDLVDKLAEWETLKETRIMEIKDKIKSVKKEIKWSERQIKFISEEDKDNCNKIKTQLQDWERKEFRLSLDKTGIQEKIEMEESNTEKIILKFKNPKRVCETCGAPISKGEMKKQKIKLSEQLTKMKSALKDWKIERDKIVEEHEKIKKSLTLKEALEKSIRAIKKQQEKNTSMEIRKSILVKQSLGFKKDLEKINTPEKPPTDKTDELKGDLKSVRQNLLTLKQDKKSIKKEININQWLIKDPLSNSGLKAFIFDSMLAKVNNHLQQYKSILGFGIKLYIDMSMANKDIKASIFKNGDELPYEDLSGGQKQLTNIAMVWALGDTVNDIKPINIKFLDELFESLSEDNVEKVGNILVRKAVNKSMHVITHLKDFTPTNCHTTHVTLNSSGRTQLI